MTFDITESFIDTSLTTSESLFERLRPHSPILFGMGLAAIIAITAGSVLWYQSSVINKTRNDNSLLHSQLESVRRNHFEALVARIQDMPFDPRGQELLRDFARKFACEELEKEIDNPNLATDDQNSFSTNFNASLRVVNATVGENYRHVDIRIEDPSTRQFIQNLTRKDFELTIDGKRIAQAIVQRIETSLEKRAIAIVQDKSASMKGLPDTHANQAIGYFIKTYAGPSTKIKPWMFANDVRALTPWTSDKDLLLEACKLETPNGSTWIYLAFEKAVADLSLRPELKTLVLLTDGADSQSSVLPPGIEERCRQANITVYIVGIKSPSLNENVLQQLSIATGGKYFRADDSAQIATRFKEIAEKVFVPAYRILAFVPGESKSPIRLEVGNASIEVLPQSP